MEFYFENLGGANFITNLWASPLAITLLLFTLKNSTSAQNCTHNGITDTITTNTSWSGTMNIQGDIFIQTGATLTVTGTLNMRPNSKIEVNTSARLIVDGGTLTTQCDSIWLGVFVIGDNTLPQYPNPVWAPNPQGSARFLNDALVEHALIGVSSWDRDDLSTTGGIIQVLSSTFKNNYTDVEIMPYPAANVDISDNYNSSIKNSVFIDDNNRKPNHLSSQNHTLHVSVWGVKGINIFGSEFKSLNYNGGITEGETGVRALNASVVITSDCDQPDPPVFPCPPQYITYPKFENLYDAVLLRGSPDDHTVVDKGIFLDNFLNINIDNIDNARVTKNQVVMRPQFFPHPGTPSNGIFMQTGDGYWVEENYLQAIRNSSEHRRGIVIEETGWNENEVYRNTLKDFTGNSFEPDYAGAVSLFTNRHFSLNSGLQFLCNTFLDNNLDISIRPQLSNPLIGLFGIRPIQGEQYLNRPYSTAGNTFEHNYTYFADIMNYTLHIDYYHGFGNTVPSIVGLPGHITLDIAPEDHLCPSGFGGGSQELQYGLDGLYIDNDEMSMLYSDLNESLPQYTNALEEHNIKLDDGNTSALMTSIFNVSNENDAAILYNDLLETSPFVSRQVLYVLSLNGYFSNEMAFNLFIENPDATRDQALLDHMINKAIYPFGDDQIADIEDSWDNTTERTYLIDDISVHGIKASRAIKKIIYQKKFDTANNYEELINLYDSWPSLRYKYAMIEMMYKKGDHDEAEQKLYELADRFSLTEKELFEYNLYKDYYDQRHSIFSNDRFWTDLTPTEKASLEHIAYASLGTGSQLAALTLCMYFDQCEKGEPYSPNELQESLIQKANDNKISAIQNGEFLKITPNPAQDQIQVNYLSKENDNIYGHLTILNMEGKPVQNSHIGSFPTSIDIEGLKPGIYIIHFESFDNKAIQQRFIKN